MFKPRDLFQLRWNLIIVMSLVLISGCDGELNQVTTDKTPPSVVFEISRPGEKLTVSSSDVVRTVNPDDKLELVASGEDQDGAVRRVKLDGNYDVECIDDVAHTLGTWRKDINLEVADVDLLKVRQAQYQLDISALRQLCVGNSVFNKLNGQVRAEAENFAGSKTTTAYFKFSLP